MRVALVVHGLPPYACTGVETHAANLAGTLSEQGVQVEVFSPLSGQGGIPYAQRREVRRDGVGQGSWAVTWLHIPDNLDLTKGGTQRAMAQAFGAFLDRERPDCVHFEHLLRLGSGLVDAVQARGLPSLYRAHDYYLASEFPTLCAPDLTSMDLADGDAQARARLGRDYLDGIQHLGDHHGWVLPGELQPQEADHLDTLLHGPSQNLAGLVAARNAVQAHRAIGRSIVSGVDRTYASSVQLLAELSPFAGRAIECQPAGVAVRDGEAVPRGGHRSLSEVCRPLRFGFMGGIHKHKGLHVLMEAVAGLDRSEAHLVVHGTGTDPKYLQSMREKARSLGASWNGGFGAEDVPRVLAGIDVLVVPSLWVENAPFVILEAFAAGIPVIAAYSEFLKDCVQDQVNGLLFERGNAEQLQACMQRFLVEDDLLGDLCAGIRTPYSIHDEALAWGAVYADLVERNRRKQAQPSLPAHLEEFAARYRELRDLPLRELFLQVSHGLDLLGDQLGVGASNAQLLAEAVSQGSRMRDESKESRRVLEWVEREGAQRKEALDEAQRCSRWRESQLEDLQDQLRWYEERIESGLASRNQIQAQHDQLERAKSAADQALDAVIQERDWLSQQREGQSLQEAEDARQLRDSQAAVQSLTEECTWLRGQLDSATECQAHLSHQLQDTQGHIQRLEDDRREQDRLVGDAHSQLATLQGQRSDVEEFLEGVQTELESLRAHETWLSSEVSQLLRHVLSGPARQEAEPDPAELARDLSEGARELARIVAELGWRRREMMNAGLGADSWRARLVGGDLAHRAQRWLSTEELGSSLVSGAEDVR